MRNTRENKLNIPIKTRWVSPGVFVSVNGRANVNALTLADGSPEIYDAEMEGDGAIVLTYALTGQAPAQRVSTDGGRTWGNR